MRRPLGSSRITPLAARADTPAAPLVDRPGDDPAMLLAVLLQACVYFTKDGHTIPGAVDCEACAHRLDGAFSGPDAMPRVAGIDIPAPHGVNGIGMDIEPAGPDAGRFGWLNWKMGPKDLDSISTVTALQDAMELHAERDVEGHREIDVPKEADQLIHVVQPAGT